MHSFGRDFFESERWVAHNGGSKTYELKQMGPILEEIAEVTCRHQQPRRVLDIGCAKGFLVLAFRRRGIEAYGCDISEWALSMAPDEVRPYLTRN